MNEEPQSIWHKPWSGPKRTLAWLGLLAAATFLVICALSFAEGERGRNADAIMFALVTSLIITMLVGLAVWAFQALRSWRNARVLVFAAVCLVTLVALLFAEENWRGHRVWKRHLAELKAQDEKLVIADLAPPPVPEAQNFALTPLLAPLLDMEQTPNGLVRRDTNAIARVEKLDPSLSSHQKNDQLVLGNLAKGTFADLPACAEFYRGNTNYPQAPASANPAETILTALSRFDPELKELRQAAHNRPYSRFPIQYEYEPSWGILLPHLAPIKRLAILTQVRALGYVAAGESDEALQALQLGLRLSDSIKDEPLLIDHLVRLAALGIDLQTVREGLVRHAWTPEQLSTIQLQLEKINLLAEYEHSMRGERALSVSGLDFLRRSRANPMQFMSESGGASEAPNFNFLPSGWYYQNMKTISAIHQQYTLAAVDAKAHRVYPDISEQGQRAVTGMRRSPYTFFAGMLLPAVQKSLLKTAHMQVNLDAACVACALERYRRDEGKLPEALDALSPKYISQIPGDVIDGKPLRWQPEADGGYKLYSVGWNKSDDGGQIAWKKPASGKKQSEPDDFAGDWVWQMPASLDKATIAQP